METERLIIRKFRESDGDALYRLLSDREVMRFLEPPYSMAQSQDFLYRAALCTPPLILAVEHRNGEFVGYVIYHSYGTDAYEIGWVLHKKFWHRGYARELTGALITDARGKMGRLIIECAPAQAATAHIALQCGFHFLKSEDGCDVYCLELDG